MNYVGIDHHRQYSHLTVMDPRGQVLRSGRVPNLQSEIGRFLKGLEAVIETGRSSYTMVDVLEEMGMAVKIAHPHEVKTIARAQIKTDKRNAITFHIGDNSAALRNSLMGLRWPHCLIG